MTPMAKQWTCARCSTKNDEGTLTCTNCRMIRGAVVVPGSTWNRQPDAGPPDAAPPDAPAPYAPPSGAAPWDAAPPDAPSPADGQPSPGWQAAQWPGHEASPGSTATPSDVPSPGTNPQPIPAAGQGAPGEAPSYWSSAGPGYPAEAAAPERVGRRLPIGWLIFVILLGVGAVASFVTSAGRSDTGQIVNDGDMMATDLRVGDCFDLKDPTAEEISDVTAKPCTDAHEYELFWTGSMAEGAFPTDAAFQQFFETNCIGAFQPYIGKGYLDSELDIYWLTPLEETWDAGDRSIQCAAYDPGNDQLVGSLKGTGR